MTVTEQLRQRIRESGLTNYRIGKDLGVSIRTIDRFVTDEREARTNTFDALCEYFGMELAEKKPKTAPNEAGKKPGTGRKQAGKKPATKRKRAKKSAE